MIKVFAVRFIYCLRRFGSWLLTLELKVRTNFGSRQMRSVSEEMVRVSFSPANLKSIIALNHLRHALFLIRQHSG